jgi:hypothetical protein
MGNKIKAVADIDGDIDMYLINTYLSIVKPKHLAGNQSLIRLLMKGKEFNFKL